MKSLQIVLLAVSVLLPALAARAQDWAKAKLDKSPRHMEDATVKHGKRDVKCFLVYPEVKDKATAVLVIHEIFGLTDWVRDTADQLAAAGYIAIAPDLLSGMAPKGGGTKDFAESDALRQAIMSLPPDQVTADLNAVAKYVNGLPAANGKLVVAGFCWGGGQSFRYATNNKHLKAAFVFYGTGPVDAADIARIACPVYGFYAEMDARIGATLPKTTELMKAADKTYEPVTYKGAGHGFMRAGEDPTSTADNKADNQKARADAWTRWKELLKKS